MSSSAYFGLGTNYGGSWPMPSRGKTAANMPLLLGRTDADGRARDPVAGPPLRPLAWTHGNP